MVVLIFTIILFIGLIGMSIIIIRKIPVLTNLSSVEAGRPGVLGKLKNKVRNNGTLRSFSGEILLQKMLSKIRILTLRTDKKTGAWLAQLRQKSLEKKKKFSDDYWKRIRGGK